MPRNYVFALKISLLVLLLIISFSIQSPTNAYANYDYIANEFPDGLILERPNPPMGILSNPTITVTTSVNVTIDTSQPQATATIRGSYGNNTPGRNVYYGFWVWAGSSGNPYSQGTGTSTTASLNFSHTMNVTRGQTYYFEAFGQAYGEFEKLGANYNFTVPDTSTTYTVTYNGNGNTGGSAPSSQTFTANQSFALRNNTSNLVKSGYAYEGWNTQANGNGTHYNAGQTVAFGAGNVTLYAEWSSNTQTPTSVVFINTPYSAQIPASGSTTTTVTARVLDQNGNTMNGYNPTYSISPSYSGVSINGNSGVVTIQSTAAAGTVNLQATYGSLPAATANLTLSSVGSFTVSFVANGGTPAPQSQTIPSGGTVSQPPAMDLSGHTFGGWYTTSNFSGSPYNFSTSVNSSFTLYAKWNIIVLSPAVTSIKVLNCEAIINSVANNSNCTVNDSDVISSTTDIKNNRPFAISVKKSAIQYAYETNSDVSSVKCDYRYSYSTGYTATNAKSKSGTFNINIPTSVSSYKLYVRFKFYSDANQQNEIPNSEKIFTHDVYVLLDKPVDRTVPDDKWGNDFPQYNSSYVYAKTKLPRIAWLDFAMELLKYRRPTDSAAVLVNNLNMGIYDNPRGWQYGNYSSLHLNSRLYFHPTWLIENRKPTSVSEAMRTECNAYSNILRILAYSLGVDGIEYRPAGYEGTIPYGGYILKPGSTTLDNNAGINSYYVDYPEGPIGLNTPPTAWRFDSHMFSVFSGRYYDPTFGITGNFANYISDTRDPRNLDDSPAGFTNNLGWVARKYWLIPSTSSSMTDLEKAKKRNEGRLSITNSALNFKNRTPPMLYVYDMDTRLLDEDNNELAEWLVLDVNFDSTSNFECNVVANIYAANEELICSGSLTTEQRAQALTELSITDEDSSLSVYFNGFNIRQSGLDGPYTIEFNIYYGTYGDEPIITEWHETGSMTYDVFQGTLLDIVSVSDSTANQGENIRFTVTIDAEVTDSYTLSGSLYKDELDTFTWLESFNQEVNLLAGNNQVQIDFDAKAIKGKGISGPYNLVIYAKDRLYSSSYDHISANYQLSQLASPAAYLRNPIYSSNSSPNQITVFVPLNVTVASTYYVYGSIWDDDFNLVSVKNLEPALSVGTTDIQLIFDTSAINEYGLTGPYTVSVGVLDQAGNSQVLENYQL